jgi:hypothetical protein
VSDRVKGNLLKYGISSAFAGVLVYIYCSSRNVFLQPELERWRILCDAFTIPGLTLIMVGFLVMVANEGFFDMLSYATSKAVGMLVPGRGFVEKDEKYYDYLQRKKGKRATGFGFLFVVGGVCMALAMLFLFLFYRLYN